MNRQIERHSTKGMTKEQWLAFRSRGLGGSEVGAVMGLNPYYSSLELFYNKLMPTEKEENEPMFWGTALQDLVLDRWQFWETDAESMIRNMAANKMIRKRREVKAYLINNKYAWLFASLDSLVPAQNGIKEGVLEGKCMNGWMVRQWENGIPPSHVVQLQTYLLITELKWGEMVVLIDGRKMDVIPFERSPIVVEKILTKTWNFWDAVLKAREVFANEGVLELESLSDSARGKIHSLEPPPDDSEAYAEYLSKKFTAKPITILGDEFQLLNAKAYSTASQVIKETEQERTGYANRLKSALREAEMIDFGAAGKVTWKANEKGTRVFNVRLKEEI